MRTWPTDGIAVCAETLPRILHEAGLSHQRTRSWKWSPDPDFGAKAERVLSLYREPPADGPVVCFDEMGPIQLIPHQGAGWAPVGLPERQRASSTSARTACATSTAPTTSTPTA